MCVSVSSGEARVVKAAGPYSQHWNSHSDFRSWLFLDASRVVQGADGAGAHQRVRARLRLASRLLAVADGGYPP